MFWIVPLFLSLLLCGCGQSHEENDPYVLENTEVEYQAPAPYYDEDGA